MGTVLAMFNGVVWLYVMWRFVRPLPLARVPKAIVAIALLLAAEYRWIVDMTVGGIPSQVLPRDALIVLAWAYGAFLLLALLLIVRELVGLLTWLVRRSAGRRILTFGKPLFGIGLLALALSAWGTWQGVKVPAVKTVDVHLAGLPPAFDGYRIVQLTDLHATRLLPASWIADVVAKSNALRPDLIVVTGDLQDGMPSARRADVLPLSRLHAPDGVLMVPGNHEYYSDYRGWMGTFRQLGLHELLNAHVLIHHDGATLAVAGLTDRAALRFGLPAPDLQAALEGIPPDVPVMVLSHRPGSARTIAKAGALLELAGHTHGGQILGPSLLTKWANNGFVSGLYRIGAMRLYVSNGTGIWAGLPLRLGRPSEITQIILHAAQ
ncbi:MAG TPA: metallophosphoesterase [Oleiagrimonas sp.]|nr:metallophosphoesterase [Oleiagrimonas sp.]